MQPKLEAEIGILLVDGEAWLAPCVEVADCRFGAWAVPPACAVADFGLQGAMLFGAAVAPIPRVGVTVSCDGSPVAEGAGDFSDAVERLAMVPGRLGPLGAHRHRFDHADVAGDGWRLGVRLRPGRAPRRRADVILSPVARIRRPG